MENGEQYDDDWTKSTGGVLGDCIETKRCGYAV